MLTKRRIDIAMGREPADLVLTNGRIVNVFTREVQEGELAISDGVIAGIGPSGTYSGTERIDLEGRYVVPGFIDSHVHIESSLVSPEQFARLVVPFGTTTIVADPHEIANVAGLNGIRYMIDAAREVPLDVRYMLPSCVPSTSFENAGAVLDAAALAELIDDPAILGLGEMMDYPSLLAGDADVLAKINLAAERGKRIDGHAPMVVGQDLVAYRAGGIESDHECSTVAEMQERLRLGLRVLIREGSAARNLATLVSGLTPATTRRCSFCTDDKQPEDILKEGHINYNVRLAIRNGVDPLVAIQMATLNAAEGYGLAGKGALAPGYDADIVVLDDLERCSVREVYKGGVPVARGGTALFTVTAPDTSSVTGSVNVSDLSRERFRLTLTADRAVVIGVRPDDLITDRLLRTVSRDETGHFQPSSDSDICKLAVIERQKGSGNVGLGLVEGFQLRGGAIATTIAHDSHNLIVVGDNDGDMLLAAEELIRCAGGMTVCVNGTVRGTLPLPIAGLMSTETGEHVQEELSRLNRLALGELGMNPAVDPFMALSFLALPVIPALKLTDMGLFDVSAFTFTDINGD
ncbi:MAG: adenine deaminase [Spirochaeta sp.]|nr:adenine deaminase [Spirochaeta sp.]